MQLCVITGTGGAGTGIQGLLITVIGESDVNGTCGENKQPGDGKQAGEMGKIGSAPTDIRGGSTGMGPS